MRTMSFLNSTPYNDTCHIKCQRHISLRLMPHSAHIKSHPVRVSHMSKALTKWQCLMPREWQQFWESSSIPMEAHTEINTISQHSKWHGNIWFFTAIVTIKCRRKFISVRWKSPFSWPRCWVILVPPVARLCLHLWNLPRWEHLHSWCWWRRNVSCVFFFFSFLEANFLFVC